MSRNASIRVGVFHFRQLITILARSFRWLVRAAETVSHSTPVAPLGWQRIQEIEGRRHDCLLHVFRRLDFESGTGVHATATSALTLPSDATFIFRFERLRARRSAPTITSGAGMRPNGFLGGGRRQGDAKRFPRRRACRAERARAANSDRCVRLPRRRRVP